MTTLSPHASSSTTHSSKADAADFEPDEEWKKQLKARIQLSLQSLIQDAKDNLMTELRKAVVSPEDRKQLDIEYKAAMGNIKHLANEQYEAELEKERNQRRWIAGEPMLPGWSTYLKAEQEHIMNTIKQGSDQPASSERLFSHPPSPQRTAPTTPATRTPEPRETHSSSSVLSSPHRKARRRDTESSTITAPSTPDPDDLPHPQEREKPHSRQHSQRRPSMPSRDHEEEPSPVGRRSNGTSHDRPSNASTWMSAEVIDEPEELLIPASSRTRYSADKAPDRPWESGSLGRSSGGSVRSLTMSERGHSTRSPTNQVDELLTSKPYTNQVHRRGSTTSMRSTGSGASIRPMTETIPERDDIAEEGSSPREWAHEPEKARKSTDKARDKEKRLARRDSRSTPADVNIPRHDEMLGSGGGMRSAGPSSATMQYATNTSPIKSLSNKSSFVSVDERERERYYQDRPPKAAPYVDQHYAPHREARYPPQDRELPRPPPSRSSYSAEDRDYTSPVNLPPPRPPPPRSPYNGDDRDYTPVRDLLASRPTSSRPYNGEERDYHTPSPSVRSPPPRSPYDDNYSSTYAPPPPPPRHVNGANREYGPPPPAHIASFNYDDRRPDGWERPDREQAWDDDHRARDRELPYPRGDRESERIDWERENQREREREREPYPDTHLRSGFYAYGTPPRPQTYPATPASATRHGHPNRSHDYLPVGDHYEAREPAPPPSRAYSYPLPPQSAPPGEHNYEYDRQESTRSVPPTRQGSYSRREPMDRRTEDLESAHPRSSYPYVPPRPPPPVEEVPEPAWRTWGRSPQDVKPPPTKYNAQLRAYAQGDPKSKHRSYRNRPPADNSHYHPPDPDPDTESASDDEDVYSDEVDLFGPDDDDSEDADDENDRRRSVEEPETSDGEEVQARRVAEPKLEQQEFELKRLKERDRRLEEETRKKEEEVRRKEQELQRKAEEAAKRAEEARRREQEAQRKANEARLKEEEAQRMADEARRMEEELKLKEEQATRKAEEAKRIEEEARQKAEEARRKEDEARKKEDEAKKKEAEAKKKEREVNRREQEAKKKAADAKKLEEEAKRKEDEVRKKEEATRRKEEKLKQESEKTKMLQQEAQKIAEEALEKQEKLKQQEEEARKWEKEIWEREQALHIREEELKRREAEAKQKEEEARRLEIEAQLKEAEAKKEEQAREAARREQMRVAEEKRRAREEAAAKRDEVKQAEHNRLAQEEAAKREAAHREEQAREEASLKKVMEEETRRMSRIQLEAHQREAAMRREEAMRREQARCAQAQSEPPFFDPDSLFPTDVSEDLFSDPKFREEQAYIWQQLQYQQQADTIQRKRQEERTRHDSFGSDFSSWPYPPAGTPSQPPPPSSSRPPQSSHFNSPSPSERSSGTSATWTGTGSAWSTSKSTSTTSATSATSSRMPNGTQPSKPAMNIPSQGKPRTGSFSSGTYPTGSSPHSAPGTEEWQRRQAEFTNAQQEKFRREQERLEAENQMRSAGKPLSRDDMQRVFERHERLWTLLPQKADLTWNDFPWPMSKTPANPDDISAALVGAYMRSNCWPDNDKSKSTKDRIKEHIKRWHPDRFETKLLPKVVESEKDKVQLGAGNVARYLSDLLRKENDSSSNIFGD